MALYYSKGTISDMSEVQSGVSRSGNNWSRMTLTLEIPGYQGSVTKQVFQVFGDSVNDVLQYSIGDRVQVGFSLYAREWNGKMYNNVDLVNITDESGAKAAPAQEKPKSQEQQLTQETLDLDPATNPDDLPF